MNTDDDADQQAPREDHSSYAADAPVLYAAADGIATITLNRPQFGIAQNSQIAYALDAAFRRAVDDDAVRVIVLRGAGKHSNAGHDIGTAERDAGEPFERMQLRRGHAGRPDAEAGFSRASALHIGTCRRGQGRPRPTHDRACGDRATAHGQSRGTPAQDTPAQGPWLSGSATAGVGLRVMAAAHDPGPLGSPGPPDRGQAR